MGAYLRARRILGVMAGRALCSLADIPDGGTLNFPSDDPAVPGLFAYRRGEDVRVFVNSCPHLGVPLDWAPGMFLSADHSHFVCSTHWAKFELLSGECFDGPCAGERLDSVACAVADGMISISNGSDV